MWDLWGHENLILRLVSTQNNSEFKEQTARHHSQIHNTIRKIQHRYSRNNEGNRQSKRSRMIQSCNNCNRRLRISYLSLLLTLPSIMSMAVNKYQSKASSTSISVDMNRRKSLKFAAGCLMGTSTSFLSPSLSEAIDIDEKLDTSLFYDSYRIIPDPKKLNPKLESVRSNKLLENISKKQGALWLGEHHNAASDHLLQANVIQSICDQRKLVSGDHNMGIGLEMVQRKFQSALDDYVAGKITEEEMLRLVDWEKRWFWSFSKYRPIFTVARENKIPLIALNADSEDLALVERNGLPGLSQSTLSSYIPDR